MIDVITPYLDYKKSKIKIYPCHANRASAMGDECERRLVYMRTSWDKQLLHEVDLQLIFDEGNIQEEALLTDLRNAGFKITEQQRPFSWPEYQITGMIDCRIGLNGTSYPLEIKSMSPNVWKNINTIEDLNRYPWTKKYVSQIVLYLLMGNAPEAILLLKNKSTGKVKQLNITLNDYLDLGESLLQKAQRINKHVADGTFPSKINTFKVCSECNFRHLCLPEILSKGGVEFIDNEKLESNLNRRASLASASKEYDSVDEEVKEELKRYMQDKENISCGPWIIEKKVNKKGSVSFDINKLEEPHQ
jgi:CRISPR/Cas system-associated exonuclease Cas4 (RecB family)